MNRWLVVCLVAILFGGGRAEALLNAAAVADLSTAVTNGDAYFSIGGTLHPLAGGGAPELQPGTGVGAVSLLLASLALATDRRSRR